MNPNLAFLAIGILIALFGAFFGSFCSKVIFRLEDNRMNVRSLTAASVCPNCFKKIAFKDKIPIVSYFLIGGKCRRCEAPITKRYLVLEIIGMVLPFVMIFLYNFDILAVYGYFFAMALVCGWYISYDGYELPKPLTIFILLLSILKTGFSWQVLLEAGLSYLISLIIISVIYTFILRKRKSQSVFFFAAAGAYLGLISSLIVIVVFTAVMGLEKFLKVSPKANLILVSLTITDFAFHDFLEQNVIRLITFIFS